MTIQHLFRTTFLGTIVAIGLAACSTTKIEDPAEDLRLRTMKPTEGMALIYFLRPTSAAYGIGMEVTCDGTHIGGNHGKRYFFAHVKPGKRVFVSSAENKAELLLVLDAGKTYFIEQKIKMGILTARNQLERIEEADGRKKLAKCKLSGDCPAYVPATAAKK
ncbi:MAG: DUF2846 domain-containing protein [Saprospiraceae bacterium]